MSDNETVTMVGPDGSQREVSRWSVVQVTRAQFRAAAAIVQRSKATGRPVRPGVERIAELEAENAALKRWQAKRVVALSQDPTCIKWMHDSEALERVIEVITTAVERAPKAGIDDGSALADVVMVSAGNVEAAIQGACGYGRCYCGGCVL